MRYCFIVSMRARAIGPDAPASPNPLMPASVSIRTSELLAMSLIAIARTAVIFTLPRSGAAMACSFGNSVTAGSAASARKSARRLWVAIDIDDNLTMQFIALRTGLPVFRTLVRVSGFLDLLRSNRNYRNCWLGQTVSEIGDHFNSVAVLSLALHLTGSGFTVGAVMIARVLPAVVAGPIAGVVLDRFDRRKVMIASDLLRCVVALLHILLLTYRETWLLYTLSGLLMFASPFFNSGRSAILPRLANRDELHTANALTQT